MSVRDYDYEWCMACDGDGKIGSTEDGDYRDCPYCGGRGHIRISKKQKEIDAAEAAKLQATLDKRNENET